MRYHAFISYSHVDERAARHLHRWLETYRVPRHIAGRQTDAGIIPTRLSPIFRDRNELAASENLSAEVISALAASRALIVLCSPSAKGSNWVNSEIRLFRTLHPNGKILVGMLAGDPGSSFPSALLESESPDVEREPVAADFRKAGDGARLARLKIIAGMIGVRLDELIQRDSQRQLRRVTWITLVSLALALLLGFMLVFALNARSQTERQRQQAEGLIEFMLTDLRSRLQGVGRLDILGAVNVRALAYYSSEKNLAALPDASLERRARVLHAMGADDQRLGRTGRAQIEFDEARRVTAALLDKDPENPDRLYAHAQSEFWLGYVEFARRNDDAALPRFEAYLRLARKLLRVAPNDARSIRELAYAQGNICSLALDRTENDKASLNACHSALVAMRRVAQFSPGDQSIQSDLANREAWMAQALENAGRLNDALSARERQIRIVGGLLADDPVNAAYRQDKMLAQFSTAKLLGKMGRSAQASEMAGQAATGLDALLAIDPKNEDWRLWHAEMQASFPDVGERQ